MVVFGCEGLGFIGEVPQALPDDTVGHGEVVAALSPPAPVSPGAASTGPAESYVTESVIAPAIHDSRATCDSS